MIQLIESPVDLACEVARTFEGFVPTPYLCPAGVPTIGYGTTRYPSGVLVTLADDAIDKETAEAYLRHEMQHCFKQAMRICPNLTEQTTYDQAAIVDFVYNLGSGNLMASTLRRRIRDRIWADVPPQLRRWVKGGGRILRGLVLRREAEIALWEH